jgi:fucose permease
MGSPYALGFSLGIFLYVAAECAVYVWMPTLMAGYTGRLAFLATYGISVFFVLRAIGRFLGSWVLARYSWTAVMAVFSFAILICFAGSVAGGVGAAVWLLPLSGLFMSMIYPTLNSKGISCFPKAEHGAVAGVILFFTCAAAALGPLAMGAVSDAFGHPKYGFILASAFAALLFVGLLLNWIYDPARKRLAMLDSSEYTDSGAS